MRATRSAATALLLLTLTGCDAPADALVEPTPVEAAPAQRTPVAALHARRDACKSTPPEWWTEGDGPFFPGPTELMDCDGAALVAAGALTGKSSGTAALSELMPLVHSPLGYALTGGEEALAYRVVVASAQTDFAVRRAAILTGEPSPLPPPATKAEAANPFAPIGAYAREEDPAALHHRWIAIRDADCAAYPVPDCAARLDAALNEMITGTLAAD